MLSPRNAEVGHLGLFISTHGTHPSLLCAATSDRAADPAAHCANSAALTVLGWHVVTDTLSST